MEGIDRQIAVVRRIGDDVVPHFDRDEDSHAYVAAVMKQEGITYADFVELDERPGKPSYGGYDGINGAWHHRLRRARNAGVGFFDALKK